MGLEKKTKIIIIVIVVLVVLAVIGLLLGILLPSLYVVLEVWPRSEEYSWEEPVIQFRPSDPGSWHPWVERLNEFLRPYENAIPEIPSRGPCSVKHIHDQRAERARSIECRNAMEEWNPCTVDSHYGYAMGSPCVFLRLSHIHYWVPEPYNRSLPLPPDMPEHLLRIIRESPAERLGDHIWVTCNGEFSADKENIGPIQVLPRFAPGFPTRRLRTYDRIPRGSTRNHPDPEPVPLVAVFFENPRRGVLINVECRIWSRDIMYDPAGRIGRARFEIFVEFNNVIPTTNNA